MFVPDDFPYARLIIKMVRETHQDAKYQEGNHLGGRNPVDIAKMLFIGGRLHCSEGAGGLKLLIWRNERGGGARLLNDHGCELFQVGHNEGTGTCVEQLEQIDMLKRQREYRILIYYPPPAAQS
jgi:hypothetical protein